MSASNVTSTPSLSTRFSVWFKSIPLVTRSVIAVCVTIQLIEYIFGSVTGHICIYPPKIVNSHEYWRLFTAAWFHGGILHILMNMMAFQGLGTTIERQLGSLSLLYNIILFDLLIAILHVFISSVTFYTGLYLDFLFQCTVGLSGVIFALLVININNSESPSQNLFGFLNVPTKIYPWVLLIVLQIIMPGVSFVGHLSGILIGYLYSYGYLDRLQFSSTTLSSIESSCFFRGFMSLDGWISNPSLGSGPKSSGPFLNNILPVFRASPSTHAFSGTGQVLGNRSESPKQGTSLPKT